MRVRLTISDPWELGESIQWIALPGQMLRVAEDGVGHVLVKLDAPIDWNGVCWSFVIGTPRHIGERIESLRAGAKVAGAFTGITPQQATLENPFETNAPQRGLAFIAEIEPEDTTSNDLTTR